MVSCVCVGSSAAKDKTACVNKKNKPTGRSNFIWRAQLSKIRLLSLAEFNFVTKQVEKIGELKPRTFLGVFVNSIGSRGNTQLIDRLPAGGLFPVLSETPLNARVA